MKYNFTKLFATGGGIQKYEAPSNGVSYNFGEFTNNIGNSSYSTGPSSTTISFEANWQGDGKYATVQDLENSKEYQDYTNYVINNENDPQVQAYLKELERVTVGDGPHGSILYNPDGTLKSNWKDIYQRLRTDGKYGYYHQSPDLSKPQEQPEPEPDKPNMKSTTAVDFDPVRQPNYTPWTDWIPLSAQFANDMFSNARQAELQKKQKYALYESPYQQAKVTNAYAARSAQNAQISDMQARSEEAAAGASDLRAGMKHQLNTAQQATSMRNQLELEKANEFNQTTSQVQSVANDNTVNATSIANQNRQINVAAQNNILNANAKRDLSNLQSMNSYIANMTTSHGNWLQNQRMEDENFRQTQAYENYLNTNRDAEQAIKDLDDYTKSAAWQEFRNSEFAGSGGPADQNDDEWYKTTWESGGEQAQEFIKKYDDWKKSETERIQKIVEDAGYQYRFDQMYAPTTFSNQGYYRPLYRNTRGPLFQRRSFSYKKGGKTSTRDRFLDYMNHFQKEQQSTRKETFESNKYWSQAIQRKLDNLDKQELALLRAIFK